MIEIEEEFGISAQIGIVHTHEVLQSAKNHYSDRFVFAKYLSLSDIAQYNVEPVIKQIETLKEEGFSLSKSWFGPRWRDYIEKVPADFAISDSRLEPIFQTLEDNRIPLLIHIADPDTYFAAQYSDSKTYGTKEDQLNQLETVIARHPKLIFQLPHFGSQPEIHRLHNLSRWLDSYPNIVLDTASSRWMARELSKDVEKARKFMIRHSDRVLFGTDISSNGIGYDYYSGRYNAQRILWETRERNTPLPFPDPDTKNSGGTFINGLDLPISVLKKLYWKNADRIYDLNS